MDKNQQNLIKPTNHKKNLGLFLVGIFRIWDEKHKIKLENEGVGSNFVRNHGS
jgi:hypothetical protein